MSIDISKQNIVLLVLSIFLLIFVLIFSFLVLIPKGQEYREQRSKLNDHKRSFYRYEEFHNATLNKLKELQSSNRQVITSFDTSFSPNKFQKLHSPHFSSLTLSQLQQTSDADGIATFEVNTSSSISSPQSFYNFLDALNNSDWVIGVNFPINFKRDSEMIRSSFTMKVYKSKK